MSFEGRRSIIALLFVAGLSAGTQETGNFAPFRPSLRFEPAANDGRYLIRGGGVGGLVEADRLALLTTESSRRRSSPLDRVWPLETQRPTSRWIEMHLVGADPASRGSGLDPQPGVSHYLTGSGPAMWRTEVPHYSRIKFDEVYTGIDVVYYEAKSGLEFDFLLSPGADASQIRLRFEGADDLRVDEGGHLILSEASSAQQLKPKVYQEVDGQQKVVAGSYVLAAHNEVTFQLGEYDPALPLVIDPVVVWSRTLGGNGIEGAFGIDLDDAGNIYVVGQTGSTDFPVEGPLQGSSAGGGRDAFITKFSPDGQQIIYSTYLGGSGVDNGLAIAVDGSGRAYVCGDTTSADFPVQGNVVQPSFGGGLEAFVARLNLSGSALAFSTYLGGPGPESCLGIGLDSASDVIVTGVTGSPTFATTDGAFQTTFGGLGDVFVTKLSSSLNSLRYSTLLGGAEVELGLALTIDSSDRAVIAGQTNTPGLPTTPTAVQSSHGGMNDGFAARFSADGSELEYLTYLGGSDADGLQAVSLDTSGNAWLAGSTSSTDLPVTADATQSEFGGGPSDGLLARLPLPGGAALTQSRDQLLNLPFIAFSGDAQVNVILSVLFSGPFLFLSLSNSGTDVCGETVAMPASSGLIEQRSPDGAVVNVLCLPRQDATSLARSGNGVIGAGFSENEDRSDTDVFLARNDALLVGAGPGFEVDKEIISMPNDPARPGDTIRFRVTLTNGRTTPARDVKVREVSGGLENVRNLNITPQLGAAPLRPEPAFDLNLDTMEVGQVVTIEYDATVLDFEEGVPLSLQSFSNTVFVTDADEGLSVGSVEVPVRTPDDQTFSFKFEPISDPIDMPGLGEDVQEKVAFAAGLMRPGPDQGGFFAGVRPSGDDPGMLVGSGGTRVDLNPGAVPLDAAVGDIAGDLADEILVNTRVGDDFIVNLIGQDPSEGAFFIMDQTGVCEGAATADGIFIFQVFDNPDTNLFGIFCDRADGTTVEMHRVTNGLFDGIGATMNYRQSGSGAVADTLNGDLAIYYDFEDLPQITPPTPAVRQPLDLGIGNATIFSDGFESGDTSSWASVSANLRPETPSFRTILVAPPRRDLATKPFTRGMSTAVGDIDNDGDEDLVLAFQRLHKVLVYRVASGQFRRTVEIGPLPPTSQVELADLDGDSNLDLILLHPPQAGDHLPSRARSNPAFANSLDRVLGGSVSISVGDGTGNFGLTGIYPLMPDPVNMAIGNFDGVGGLDIVVVGRSGRTVQLTNQN